VVACAAPKPRAPDERLLVYPTPPPEDAEGVPVPYYPCGPPGSPPPPIELVESVPAEVYMDNVCIDNTSDVWLDMIKRATRTIDFAEFYASEAPLKWWEGNLFTPIQSAIEDATMYRGVRVRFLVDASFAPKYPEALERMSRAGVVIRQYDVGKRSGGVHHAKYFVVDGVQSFVGSQNFDWRSLEHIQEVGVRVRSHAIAGALEDVFETDWALAAGGPSGARVRAHGSGVDGNMRLVTSPRGWLPDETAWDLPRIVGAIDAARRAVDVQVLLYKTKDRAGAPFPTLDAALRRAAARGVAVRLLVSEWGAEDAAVLSLARAEHVEARVMTIPKESWGDIPFARVAHAKYMIADDVAWVGTSNWEGDYFFKSRNVGVVVDGGDLPKKLRAFFESNWTSEYAAPPSSTGSERR
jgi:phosphatidylserine/phosphatidylglycerophosphate/cardiolipin synthase-like enzyme